MRLLLTSAGISNLSINDALVGMLGKPIADASALVIPTAIYPFSTGPHNAAQMIRGLASNPLCELGWKSLGVLELTALPSIRQEVWVSLVQETDALLVWGGDPVYLSHWMRESGLGAQRRRHRDEHPVRRDLPRSARRERRHVELRGPRLRNARRAG
jgi:dipeptidase E